MNGHLTARDCYDLQRILEQVISLTVAASRGQRVDHLWDLRGRLMHQQEHLEGRES